MIRVLERLLSVAISGVLLWYLVDPEGPQEAWQRLRDYWREQREYAEALRRTWEDIERLPTVDEGA